MALVLKWKSPVQTNQGSTELYLTDDTGVYDETTNVGGYGGINPLRTQLALVVLAYAKKTTGDELIELVAYDPETPSVFTIPITTNVRMQVTGYLLVKDSGSTTVGDWQFDTATQQIQQYVSGAWADKTIEDLYNVDGALVIQKVVEIPVVGLAVLKQNELLDLWYQKLLAGPDDHCEDDTYLKIHDNLRGRIRQASNNFCDGNYYEFQRTVEAINEYIEKLGV
jgi:hypothetical protein